MEKVKTDTSVSKGSKKVKTRHSDAELAEFKELIEVKCDAARKEVKSFEASLQRRSNNGIGKDFRFDAEDGAYSQETEYLTVMMNRQVRFIDHLEKALERIANKSYGRCRDTGELISKNRLLVVPHATLSLEAKIKRDGVLTGFNVS